MEKIPNYFNDPTHCIRLLNLVFKFSYQSPLELNSIIQKSVIATSEKFNANPDFVNELIMEHSHFAETDKEKEIYNFAHYYLEIELRSRLSDL